MTTTSPTVAMREADQRPTALPTLASSCTRPGSSSLRRLSRQSEAGFRFLRGPQQLFDLPVLQGQGFMAIPANMRTPDSELDRAKGIASQVDPGAAAVPGTLHPGFQLESFGTDHGSIVRRQGPSGFCRYGSQRRCTKPGWPRGRVSRAKATGVSKKSHAHCVLLSD
jgi:hypothetical protein